MGKYNDAVRYARSDPASLWAARQIGIKNLNSSNDVRGINEYLKNNETPWDRDIRLAREQTDRIAAQSAQLTQTFNDTVTKQAEENRRAIEQVSADISAGYESRISGLVDSFNAERARFTEQFNLLQGQYDKQTSAFNDLNLQYTELNELNQEQQRIAANVSRSSVPDPVQSAELPISGDQRDSEMRKGKNNNLSSLTVLSGLNTGNSSNTGLQLA